MSEIEVARLREELAIQIAQTQKAEAERDALKAEVERWTEKAQEAGAAYANANSKHHAELDRANRLEGLANRLAEKAVDLQDRAEAAEAALTVERERVARVEALHIPCAEHPTCADSDNFCHECGHDSPCATRRTILSDPDATGGDQ